MEKSWKGVYWIKFIINTHHSIGNIYQLIEVSSNIAEAEKSTLDFIYQDGISKPEYVQ